MKIINFILAIGLLFTGCNSVSNKENFERININYELTRDILLSDFVESVEFIKLEDDESAIVSGIDKLLIHQDHIYILQIYSNPRVMVFDLSGNYLFDIGKQGNGPGEYRTPYDISLSEDGSIEVLDAQSINTYNTQSGEFLEMKKLSFPAIKFKKYNKNYVFLSGGDVEENIIITDHKLNILGSFMSKNLRNRVRPFESFHEFENKIFYHETLNDTIYEIKNNQLSPYKFLAFEKPLSETALLNISEQFDGNIGQIKRNLGSYMTYISFYLESETHIYLTYKYQNEDIIHWYDKRSNTGKSYTPTSVKNDVTFETYAPFIIGTNGDSFIGYIDYPNQSTEFLGKENSPFIKKMKSALNAGNIDFDNPIIFQLKMK